MNAPRALRTASCAAALLLAALGSLPCSAASPAKSASPNSRGPATPASPAPESKLGRLPATYAGMLPCPDCLGVRMQLRLLPGGGYLESRSHLRDGRDETVYAIGAWSLARDEKTLTLEPGQGGKTKWAVGGSRLQQLDRSGKPASAGGPYELTRREASEPMEPRAELTGMFRHQADAARFRDCRSGIAWPVEMSGEYRALERDYGQRREAPGAELMVTLRGRIAARPKADGGGAEPTLVVEKFLRSMPGDHCEGRGAQAGLTETRWRPIQIGSRTVTVARGETEPWIELDSRSKRAVGSGGCNRFSGGFESGAHTLRFGQMMATSMACPAMDLESQFLRTLDRTRGYRISGRWLDLTDANGVVIARLEERNLR